MRFTVPIKSVFVSIYLIAFAYVAIGCTAAQMARTQDATQKAQDAAKAVATVPVPPNPVTDWAAIIAAGAGSLLLVEKALAKYIVPIGVKTANDTAEKNVGGLPSNSTTVTATTLDPTLPTVTESTTITQPNKTA